MNSIHPFDPFLPENAERLIIGTIPPPRFCKDGYELNDDDVNFYYGSKDNSFWKLINEVFNVNVSFRNTIEAVQERKKVLTDLNLGITDIIQECVHKNDSAADVDLDVIRNKDLSTLLSEHPKINTLIYTSEFVKKQINKMYKTYHTINTENKKQQSVKINGKLYYVFILYSPSPNALRNLGENGAEKRRKQYKEILSND